MFTHFPKRYQKPEYFLIFFLLLVLHGHTQPLGLQPEMEMNVGLRHNSVRSIIQDNRQRTYLGTESGMKILESHHPFLDTIVRQTENLPIISMNILGKFLMIGTVSSGLKIYDLQQHRQVRHPVLDSIRYVRRIRLFRGKAYVAANSASWTISFSQGKLILQKIHRPERKGFITDFTEYQGNIIAFDLYGIDRSRIFRIEGKRAIEIAYPPGIKSVYDFTILTGISKNGETVVAGDGFYDAITPEGKSVYQQFKDSISGQRFPVWEMAYVNDRLFLALGQQYKLEMGLAFEAGVNSMNDIRDDLFCQSLYYNKSHDALWIGTYNRGLFVWPVISLSRKIPEKLKSLTKILSSGEGSIYLFGQTDLHEYSTRTGQTKEVRLREVIKGDMDIIQVEKYHDTLVVLQHNRLTLFNSRHEEIVKYGHFPNQFNHFRMVGDSIYFFAMHNGGVWVQHKSGGERKLLPDVSIVSTSKPYRNGFIYFTDEKGFFFHDTVGRELKSSMTKIQEFEILGDRLFVLIAGRVMQFRINLKDGVLEEQKNILYSELIQGFTPTWMRTSMGKLFIGDSKGLMELEDSGLYPRWYRYLGNYNTRSNPAVYGDTLLLLHDGYLGRHPLTQPYSKKEIATVQLKLDTEGELYARFPISIHLLQHDYFLHRHSLKRLELEESGKPVKVFYTLDSVFRFPSGLLRGKYTARLYVNGIPAGNIDFRIRIPLLQNPVFYTVLAALVVVVFYQMFRYRAKKKELESGMLESRLQLLKKNLDPHFIFNSLNLTYMMLMQGRNEEASKSIIKFSDLHRYFLDMLNRKEVTLRDELAFIDTYLQLEQARTADQKGFSYNLPESSDILGRIKVPPLILQPLVENAVKYCGTGSNDKQKAVISISIIFERGNAILSIENTTDPTASNKAEGLKKGVGIVQEIISIYNRMENQHIVFRSSVLPQHFNPGYRCELEFMF